MRSLLISIVLVCSTARAQTPAAPQFVLDLNLKGIKSVPLVNAGAKGVWFSEADASKILQVVEDKIPQLVTLVNDQDSKMAALQLAVNKYKDTTTALNQVADDRLQIINNLNNLLKPPEPTPWYKSSEFWFVSGVVIGVVSTIVVTDVAVSALKASTNLK